MARKWTSLGVPVTTKERIWRLSRQRQAPMWEVIEAALDNTYGTEEQRAEQVQSEQTSLFSETGGES